MTPSLIRRRARERPSFSRNGTTSPFGKFDDWIERTRIEAPIKERFASKVAEAAAAAGMAGKPASEIIRDMVRVVALGPHEAKRMYGEGVLVAWQIVAGASDVPK